MKRLFLLSTVILVIIGCNKKGANSNIDNQIEEDTTSVQIITEICGVPFGASYDEAYRILTNKFGEPVLYEPQSFIEFCGKMYSGIHFDAIIFGFQSDSVNTYMNGCMFTIKANLQEEANQKLNLLYDKLAEKYEMKEKEDDNGYYYYYGGRSPVDNRKDGFMLGCFLQSSGNAVKTTGVCPVILKYGPYDYVKEEF